MRSLTDVKDLYEESYLVIPGMIYILVHLTRLELAHPKALPPQGSVYTNFTTGAYGYYSTIFKV